MVFDGYVGVKGVDGKFCLVYEVDFNNDIYYWF